MLLPFFILNMSLCGCVYGVVVVMFGSPVMLGVCVVGLYGLSVLCTSFFQDLSFRCLVEVLCC